MATATIIARTDRGDEQPLYLRLAHKDDKAYLSLDLKIRSGAWDKDKSRVRSSHAQSEYLNEYLSEVRAAADGAIARCKARGIVPRPSRLKSFVEEELWGADDEDFLQFCREVLDGYRRRGQIGAFKSYRAIIKI